MNMQLPDLVLQFGTPQRTRQQWIGAIIRTNRFTFAGTLFFGLVVPHLLHPLLKNIDLLRSLQNPGYGLSVIVSGWALLNVHILLRRVGDLPLVDDKMLILPTFVASYTLALSLGMFGFGHFGMYMPPMSFLFGLAWYYFIALARVRMYHPRLAYIGGLPDDPELLTMSIEWVPVTRPIIPKDIVGIVFDRHMPESEGFDRLMNRAVLRNIPIYETDHFREMLTGRVSMKTPPHEMFGRLLPSQPYLRVKRVVDQALAIPALIVVSPILALAALLIRLESPGPAIFRQERIGYQGRRFTCYKLRSMRADVKGPAYTRDGDPRVTRIGAVIRKWRIDELPQLINIVKGDMSWIGPRPEALSLARRYQKAIPFYAYRHSVRPGISGWAAVHQGNVALEEAASRKLEYDFYYVKNFSIWLDLLIVLMTIRTIVTGFGSR